MHPRKVDRQCLRIIFTSAWQPLVLGAVKPQWVIGKVTSQLMMSMAREQSDKLIQLDMCKGAIRQTDP